MSELTRVLSHQLRLQQNPNSYNHNKDIFTMSQVLPGDTIASIEEYEAGSNAFDDGDMIRSTVVGHTSIDASNHVANILSHKRTSVPEPGDIVIGTVAAVMSMMFAVSIQYVNGRRTLSNVECICSTRHIRRKNIALVNDIVMLRIESHLNGTIHAVMDEHSLGVLQTKCVKCGGGVVPVRDAIKCIECSWIDERVLSNKFGTSDFLVFDQDSFHKHRQ